MLEPFDSVLFYLQGLQFGEHGSLTGPQLVSVLLFEALVVVGELSLDGLHIKLRLHACRRGLCHLRGRLRGKVSSEGTAYQWTY